MIYFHYCQTYINAVIPQVDTIVKKLLGELGYLQSLKGVGKISPFTGGLYVLKFKTPHTEVILEERNIQYLNQSLTVYFVRGFKIGLQAYVEIRDGRWLEYNPLPDREIEMFLEEIKHLFPEEQNFNKPEPPSRIVDWQNDYKLKVEYDVYETPEWVRFAISTSLEDGMKDDEVKVYRLLIKDIFQTINEIPQTILLENNNEIILKVESHDLGIVFSKIIVESKIYYLLHKGANTKTQNASWEKIINPQNYELRTYKTIKDISAYALKAYPSWALNEPELWTKIEKNNEMGNLSLLPEQTDFLKDFKFPKYINGQAGSGKSTMLYYLFANAYYYKAVDLISGEIIFLTENEKLLNHTKKAVYDLLLFNPEFDLSSEDVAITNVDKHFYPFRDFLLSFLPNGNNEFDVNKYLNFSKFKILYEFSSIANHIKNKFSAELVWFTITTYVYGNNLDFQITSLNYEEKMPREGRDLISRDILMSIEKEVIKPFYEKLLSDGYWDKIKLIKYLTNNNLINRQYEVIFCDEAQDFSRVELEFILKLSIYTHYNLINVRQFPVVFAGDALQTVNPTGFSSKVLTAMIYNELTDKSIGFKLEQGQLEFTPTYNYRSSQTIVNLANAIQYYRKKEFLADVKKPQISKRPQLYKNELLNVFVDIEAFSNDEILRKKVEFKTIIVPVNNDEIESFKKKYQVLVNFENIISAADAKGIDFSEVVVFGFGEYSINESLKEFEDRFFFNKLYVAVTRAQTELVIIDGYDSKDKFWIPLIERYIKSNWINESNVELNDFSDIVVFDSNQIIESSKHIVEDDAVRQKEQGILERNVPLLAVASSHFIKLGNRREYYLCRGEIEEIKENWRKAAEIYLKKDLGNIGVEKATIAYVEGKCWSEIIDLESNLKTHFQKIRLIIARVFLDDKIANSDLKDLFKLKDKLKPLLESSRIRTEIISKFLNYLDNSINEEETTLLIELLEYCSNDSDVYVWSKLGEKYFELKRYEACILSFERINSEDNFYLSANVEVAKRKNDIESIIFWLGRISSKCKYDDKSILTEITYYYKQNLNLFINVSNVYTVKAIYFAFLIIEPKSDFVLKLCHSFESIFKNRDLELSEAYFELLTSNRIEETLYGFILQRWVKSLESLSIDEINRRYEELSELVGKEFIKFEENEISEIEVVPSSIYQSFPKHIKNIEIKNFRKFKELTISDLGLFNLVVGDNNIGKTSLLESLLFTPDKIQFLERLAFAYINRINILPDKDNNSRDTVLYYNLKGDFVNDFICCHSSNETLQFKLFDNRRIWKYEIQFGEMDTPNSTNNLINFSESDYIGLRKLNYFDNLKQPYMPYGKGYSSDLAVIYLSEIQNNPDSHVENDFLSRLELFIPGVIRITPNSKDGTILIRETQSPNILRPLHQYGDGANKLFRILILLTLHKGKILLIDEIDAGIHYSKFKQFWAIILKIAKNDDTQVIATTHNEECIKYFNEVLEELGEDYQILSRVVQMKKLKDLKVHAYRFSSFNLAIEKEIEIRGGEE